MSKRFVRLYNYMNRVLVEKKVQKDTRLVEDSME